MNRIALNTTEIIVAADGAAPQWVELIPAADAHGIVAQEAQAAIQMLGIQPQAEVFGQIIEMGREAAQVLNERSV
ncbi:hypothetical protein CO614_08845 [Lysobacteraceae bacterium NML120232]|nr:hypothetical protein CO614_08845 [Xanthomonadaceae bacterium NML120232]PJK10943.1 hypothetical protein CO608_00220 [Xanthomonadaceae bacterium NML08-0793]